MVIAPFSGEGGKKHLRNFRMNPRITLCTEAQLHLAAIRCGEGGCLHRWQFAYSLVKVHVVTSLSIAYDIA